jgi:hypothetical protein
MDQFEIIQHPLDKFILTGSMADLDAVGKDSADQLMTMIGDMQFCKGDIRGTCARYFIFIDSAWFCKLCFLAHIDCRKLQTYLLCVDNGAANELSDAFDEPQTSFCFAKNEDHPAAPFCSAAATQSETLCANNTESESHKAGLGPSIQKPAPKRLNVLEIKCFGQS